MGYGYIGEIEMTILDELDRLHKAASVYSFHNSSLEDADWVRFIEGCQKHLPALIEVARAASDLVGTDNIGKTVDIRVAIEGAVSAVFQGKALNALVKSLEKLK